MIAIIGAMKSEVEQLTARMEAVQMVSQTGMDFYVGTLAGKEVAVVQCGVGKVNAAICTQRLIDIANNRGGFDNITVVLLAF